MKSMELQGKRPGEIRGDLKNITPEVQREAVRHAKDTLAKTDQLLGKKPARTSAERTLSAQRLRLATWLKRFGFLGAIAAGNAALYAGADYAGQRLNQSVNQLGRTIGSLGDIQPIQIEFTAPAEESTNSPTPEPAPPTMITPEGGSPMQITINDPAVDGGSETDSTVHEDFLTQQERRDTILRESAILIADELQQANYFGNTKTVSEFREEVRSRLAAMGITDEGSLETAQRIAVNRAREVINEQAEHDIEGAMRAGKNVNVAFGGIDTYHLAVSHNRPDLAAELTSEDVSRYRRDMRSIRSDSDYADDPEGRQEELNRRRRDFIRDVFPNQDSSHASDVVRHLDRGEREQIASALDEEIRARQRALDEPGNSDSPILREQLERLRGQRELL